MAFKLGPQNVTKPVPFISRN